MNEICTLSDATTYTLMAVTLAICIVVAGVGIRKGEVAAARKHPYDLHKQRNATSGWMALSVIGAAILWAILLGMSRNYLCSL